MKNKSLQAVAVLLAFFIGVAINNSCGDTYQSADESSVSALWSQVRTMQTEIEQLKTEVANLKNGGGSSNASKGEFEVDGLWFDRDGMVRSKIKESYGESTTDTGTIKTTSTGNSEYKYDEYGRLVESTSTSTSDLDTVTGSSTKYEYNGKVVIRTITQSTQLRPDYYKSIGTIIYY